MAKRIKFGNVVVCEHVVGGASNKHTLINTYSGDIVVASVPMRLTLGFYFEVRDIEQDASLEIDIVIGKETLVKITAEVLRTGAGGGVSLAVPMIPIEIRNDTVLKVYFSQEGFSRTKAVEKKIFQGEIPGTILANA